MLAFAELATAFGKASNDVAYLPLLCIGTVTSTNVASGRHPSLWGGAHQQGPCSEPLAGQIADRMDRRTTPTHTEAMQIGLY
jgi:hypothetical protein